MSINLHSFCVPIFVRQLSQIDTWFDKAEAFAAARKFEPSVYLASRLAPDMLPFPRQIQIACDAAKFCVSRLTGSEAPPFPDVETTLSELRERVRKTIDYVQSVPAERFEGSAEKVLSLPLRGGVEMTGDAYLKGVVLPNFFFHMTTAYVILRHAGVEIGKSDFLGKLAP